MKKLILIIAVIAMINSCGSMTKIEPSDLVGLSKVVDIKASRGAIFDKSMIWISTNYVSPNKVMGYCDRTQGIITFNGAFEKSRNGVIRTIFYKISITIKDNKYRIDLSPVKASIHGNAALIFKDDVPELEDVFNNINTGIQNQIAGKVSSFNKDY